MDYLKRRKQIDRLLVSLYHCETSEEFYKLTTSLYYRINEIVYQLECDNLRCEVKDE